jgi:hypothetical protein
MATIVSFNKAQAGSFLLLNRIEPVAIQIELNNLEYMYLHRNLSQPDSKYQVK